MSRLAELIRSLSYYKTRDGPFRRKFIIDKKDQLIHSSSLYYSFKLGWFGLGLGLVYLGLGWV